MEADFTPMDKWGGIYGTERWVKDPDCDHGAALVKCLYVCMGCLDVAICGAHFENPL